MNEKVGFIGLGAMGIPMTAVLARNGVEMLVTDLSPAMREKAAAIEGVSVAESHAAVAAQVGVLFTCLPNNAVVRSVFLDDGGIADAGRTGLVTVDCSTVGPDVTQEIHTALKTKNISHLDASMLGSIPQAETGTIGFVVGGDAAAFDRAVPYLDMMGKLVRHAGPSGAGNRIKLIHQTLVAGHAVAVAEALALCLATETDLDTFFDIVCNGGGFAYSRYFEKRVPRMREGDFSPLFTLDLMAKDAGLGQDLARGAGVATPLLDRVIEAFRQAQAAGLGEEDFSAVARIHESAAGRRVK